MTKTMITPEQLFELHSRLTEEARKLMERKNADYSSASRDPFANFRMSGLLHVPPAIGAMLRMQDKMARLLSFIERGNLAVSEESWHDCVVDLINYSVILHGLLEELAAGKADPATPPQEPTRKATIRVAPAGAAEVEDIIKALANAVEALGFEVEATK